MITVFNADSPTNSNLSQLAVSSKIKFPITNILLKPRLAAIRAASDKLLTGTCLVPIGNIVPEEACPVILEVSIVTPPLKEENSIA